MHTKDIPGPLTSDRLVERILIALTSGEAKRFTDFAEARHFLDMVIKPKNISPAVQIEIDVRRSDGARFDASFHELEEAQAFLDYVAK